MKHAHISGALTNLSSEQRKTLRKFYEDIAHLCQKHGLTTHIPHRFTDPIDFPNITPPEAYEKDTKKLNTADILICYVGIPAIGVGTELELAKQNESLIILLYEKGKKVSSLATGNPAVIHQIEFIDFKDALEKLDETLGKLNL